MAWGRWLNWSDPNINNRLGKFSLHFLTLVKRISNWIHSCFQILTTIKRGFCIFSFSLFLDSFMFAEFDKNKEVFLSPSVLSPPRFVLRLLLTTHYYLPHLANEFNKQQTKKGENWDNVLLLLHQNREEVGFRNPKICEQPLIINIVIITITSMPCMERYPNIYRAVWLQIDRKLTVELPCVTSTSQIHPHTSFILGNIKYQMPGKSMWEWLEIFHTVQASKLGARSIKLNMR